MLLLLQSWLQVLCLRGHCGWTHSLGKLLRVPEIPGRRTWKLHYGPLIQGSSVAQDAAGGTWHPSLSHLDVMANFRGAREYMFLTHFLPLETLFGTAVASGNRRGCVCFVRHFLAFSPPTLCSMPFPCLLLPEIILPWTLLVQKLFSKTTLLYTSPLPFTIFLLRSSHVQAGSFFRWIKKLCVACQAQQNPPT